METLDQFLETIPEEKNRVIFEEVIDWVKTVFPQLELVFKWNQPMYTDHGTFIIGFSASKKHMAVAPEHACMVFFESELAQRKIDRTKELMRFFWDKPIDFELLKMMIEYNIAEKVDCESFWRK